MNDNPKVDRLHDAIIDRFVRGGWLDTNATCAAIEASIDEVAWALRWGKITLDDIIEPHMTDPPDDSFAGTESNDNTQRP